MASGRVGLTERKVKRVFVSDRVAGPKYLSQGRGPANIIIISPENGYPY